ncbi:HAD hydrolase family protein, partial [Candidatus Parcubacteria bacterium]|nr:HAD hydrolase family protein [Candidatus Parcubacteria bacterium]
VGDGANDISMIESAKLGIAFNAKPIVKDVLVILNLFKIDFLVFPPILFFTNDDNKTFWYFS